MRRRTQLTAFYLETLIMIVIMIGILLVLTQVLGSSKRESAKAKRLTEAVTVAQSVAEASSRTADLSDLQYLLELDSFKKAGTAGGEQSCEGLWRWEHKTVDEESHQQQINYMETDYLVKVSRTWKDCMASDHIEICETKSSNAIYALDVETHMKEEAA